MFNPYENYDPYDPYANDDLGQDYADAYERIASYRKTQIGLSHMHCNAAAALCAPVRVGYVYPYVIVKRADYPTYETAQTLRNIQYVYAVCDNGYEDWEYDGTEWDSLDDAVACAARAAAGEECDLWPL